MASGTIDNSQWLSVTEQTLFLHDGLIRVTDLVELPYDINTSEQSDGEVVSFDSKSPAELSDRLRIICGTHNNTYARLLEYRLNALKGYWNAQQQLAIEEQQERDATTHEETIALLKKQGLWKEPEQASFSTRFGLLLVLPLLQSQSRIDPSLCGITAELLLNCLRDCSPLSLTKEPSDCLNGLENLLSTWLGEGTPEQVVKDPAQRENTASALVALTCARGHLKTFIHTVHLLQKLSDIDTLPVADILNKLLLLDGGQGQPSAILGSKHIVCWGFEDLLAINENKEQPNLQPNQGSQSAEKEKVADTEIGRSITSDGKFLFTTNAFGRGLAKVGTGLHGTLRGYVYAKNLELPAGRVAWGNGLLLHRPVEYDKEANCPNMAQAIDPDSLHVTDLVPVPEQYTTVGAFTTVSFCSDGVNFYWFWCPGTIADKTVKGQTLNMDCCKIDKKSLVVTPHQTTLILQRKEEGSTKSLNETLLSRLRPYRSATNAATLVALGTAEPSSTRKDDSNTSCGLTLKTLLKTPIYTDGSTVVILTSVPGGSSSNAARSLFGSGTSLASLRSLATNLCFNVDDGQFISRSDLIDSPTCALARGAPVAGLGVCYDVMNNSVWTCSNDWVDQYYNPGHQARHHILGRLGIQPKPIIATTPEDPTVRRGIVIQQLLQHVGGMCLHQLHNDLLHTPLGSFILQQHPVDVTYLERVCDILDNAVHVDDRQTITCALIIFQLVFKMSIFKRETELEIQLIKRTSELVWHVLKVYQEASGALGNIDSSSIAKEACNVLCSGLNVFYPSVSERNQLLHRLLVDGEHVWGLAYLRDLVLIEFSELLDSYTLAETQNVANLRLTNNLVAYILKIAVRESCMLLRECQTNDKNTFSRILSSVPMASPCLRFLMSLTSHLLREAVLYRIPETDAEKEQIRPKHEESLVDVQSQVLSLASKIFSGAYEVLEVLLETCNSIINSGVADMEFWLQGLERVSKATILGHLLPVLLTANTHHNLRCLQMAMADNFMPQLVQLVVLTSQAALLLKSQVQAIRQDDLMDLSTDTDIADLIGDAINLESIELEEKEEQGFLAGLKIPAPWSTGKSIESIHPVRDNYKFKETVHIPGARCLFLRFDPRCSSQYDYDKLVIYAGPNSNCRKVVEYGGNTLGYGSRSVLGSGWPKDLIKVDGDTVTVTFEMRSGREHNTPDKAMWGFLITVRAQESTEEVSSGLPFLADLALGLSVLACTMLHLLYQGPEKTKEEEICQHLLKTKILQRCVWQEEAMVDPSVSFPPSADLPIDEDSDSTLPGSPRKKHFPRIRLPHDIVQKLRELSGIPAPQMRPSIKEVLKPEVLEEAILSAVIKHLSLIDTVRYLTTHEQGHSDEYFLLQEVVSETYRKLYSMIRQLQTVAELEQKWQMEVDDLKSGAREQHEIFFIDYHLVENKIKELTCLCFLKDVSMDSNKLDEVVSNLREKLDLEMSKESTSETEIKPMPKTVQLVHGLLERLNLLLHVTIAPEGGGLTRSVSHMPEKSTMPNVMVRSDTDVLKATVGYTRSMSAPMDIFEAVDDSIVDVMKLQRKRQAQRKGPVSILQDLVEEESKDRPPHVILIDQLFSFIGSTCNPETSVSCESFLSAARVRWRRGSTRQQALVHMKELLTAASRVGGATHLIAAVTSVLQQGPRVDELTCGGMAGQVRDAFAETMTSVVQLAARYPIACCNSIGLLCIIPYTRADEKCLVRCGLVHLLDRLCSLTNYRNDTSNSEAQSMRQRVSAMAWAGFQVLSNRCVMWEQEDSTVVDDLEHSGLARQVSTLLTNHLARATECSGNEAAGNEALQEVLSLLNNLCRSRMGKAILSQPGCVSRLLSLLLDQRPSPKLVLIILQLCRVALPLMTADSCDRVELPTWGADVSVSYPPDVDESDAKSVRIASLLLAKLGDFLTPGGQTTLASRRPSFEAINAGGATGGSDKDKDDTDVQDGRLSVFVHKRDDQSSHEVIQPLLSSDSRPFRLGGGANMERVVRMDREMTKHGKAEVTTEDAVSALRRAAKWAQMGLVVSTGSPVDMQQNDNASDKKKTAVEVICKDKNAELSRTDPVRPFISGHVANSMAAEVIALLHSLLTAPENLAAQTWATAVERVISHALSHLPLLINSVEDMGSPRCRKEELMAVAKQANAALAALGGFEPTVKPGCKVQITGPGIHSSSGQVLSVSEQTGLASVELEPASSEEFQPTRFSDTVQVPLSRLRPPRNEPLPLHRLSMTESIVIALQSLLLPQGHGVGSPLAQHLPIHGLDANLISNQICRVVAEIRTRACKVLASHLKDLTFASAFIQHSSAAIDILKSLAKDCSTGERWQITEEQCQQIRLLYRDCAKPPPPPSKTLNRPTKEITWDSARSFPPVRCCLFSHGITGISFLGDPSAGSGMPRGTIIYATQAVPQQAPSFYWELEISSFGDSQDDSGPIISFGFMPAAEKKDGAWTNPVGSCLFHNNGRAVHYNGSSLLQWRSVRLDVTLDSGNVTGIGWERQGDSPALPGQPIRGLVYFTFNGKRLPATLEDVAGGMWPVVHIQKKNTRIKANFGAKPFAYAEGRHHRNAADDYDLTQEIRETFGALPFNMGSDSDSEGPTAASSATSDGSKEVRTPPGPPCKTATVPKSLREYNIESCTRYKLLPCYNPVTTTGPDVKAAAANAEDESEQEDAESDEPMEDHYALLVKAWEQKVFPTIRRRFRNEAERKDGLEQIRGALQLGMTDIARQTVEFLYEENGGMPRDLHLPTIDDIKEELAKFTIERVRKGTTVVVRVPAGGALLPKFAVRGMMKTFGLTGVVLDVDQPHELVQVETYLRSEGVLVRFWYPIDMLERPPQGYRKASIIGNQVIDMSNIHIHRELLRIESILTRMYCRSSLLELISQCNSPAMEVPACSANLSSAMAASAALLQELDIENLQLLSDELLAPPQPHGCVSASSLLSSPSPWMSMASNSCAASDTFYHQPYILREELRIAIARAATQGEDYLIELSNQICICLQTAPEMFPFEEFPVNETKINTDIYFPGAAFLIVSCKADPKATRKDTSLYKSPWARIFTYRGQRVKKKGQASKQEVVCYPRDTSSSSNQSDQYSPVIIPTDLVHVRIGVSPPPGVIVTIHAVPSQLPLALTYIETLASQKYNFEHRHTDTELTKATEVEACSVSSSSSFTQSWSQTRDPGALSPWRNFDTVVIPPPVLLHVTEMICGYLWRSEIPALLKEFLFHLLAQCLRMHHLSDGGNGNMLPTLSPQYSPCLAVLQQLQAELRRLYDEETKNWASGTTVSGNGIGLGCGDSGRFSTYFHALMEVSLAVAEVSPPPGSAGTLCGQVATSAASSSSSIDAGASASVVSIPPPSSPQAGSKRKKLKAKRDRGSTTPKRNGSPRRLSESELATSPRGGPLSPSPSASSAASSLSNVSLTSGKPEDMLWFHRAVTMSQILRYLTYGEKQGEQFTNDAVADAVQALSTSMAYTRLLVISGIPTNLDEDVVRKAVVRACNSEGGLFKDEMYLPTQIIQIPVESSGTPPGETKGGEKKHSSRPGSEDKESQTPPPQSAPSPSAQLATPDTLPRNVGDSNKQTSPPPSTSNIPIEVISAKSIKGYAVIELRSKTKIENVKKALFKSKSLIEGLSFDVDELSDMPEEMLSVSTVNHTLFADPAGNSALEAYLTEKIFADQKILDLTDGVMIALTEVFHSCFISEQGSSEKNYIESGYICLSKEQIMNQAPSNLLATFFSGVRAVKKTLAEQINFILKKYGVPKLMDKDESDRTGKSSLKLAKKGTKPSKEKMALSATASSTKVSPKDRKPRLTIGTEKSAKESVSSDPATKSPKEKLEEERLLTLDGFLSYVVDKTKQDVRAVWRGLMSCGFDLRFDRCCCIDTSQGQEMCSQWNPDMDAAMVMYINKLCQHLCISPARLHPHEVYLTDAELASIDYACLQGVPIESIRLRFSLLQSLNSTLETFFLPLVDLRPCISDTLSRSSALLLSKARGSIFYDTKVVLLNRILNATTQRKPDQAAPEITLDPLENVGGEAKSALDSNFCQAYRQLVNIPSSQLCVRLAAGGDPTYAFNVRLTGEEVHGTSGSFRHFLWQVARELEGPILELLMPCPSSSSHKNRGKYILKPGPLTYPEEKLLQFLGQLLGITMRADIPLGLDLLPVFWKNLVGLQLDPITDLQEADIITYNYIKKFEMAESEMELQLLTADTVPKFIHTGLNGDEVELIPNGRHVTVNWENRQQYVDSIRSLRMSELLCHERMTALRAGMASVIPVQILPIMSSMDADVRICGLPEIDLDFLMAHTMYQVGLMESDVHVQYFWTALEGFSQDELHKFIKFACNQERIPQTCPCRDGGADTAHVPPYPMKIAPPDGPGPPDARFVRAETCMFMIKLPQYSSQAIMTERLLYAIHCREDPLSG